MDFEVSRATLPVLDHTVGHRHQGYVAKSRDQKDEILLKPATQNPRKGPVGRHLAVQSVHAYQWSEHCQGVEEGG